MALKTWQHIVPSFAIEIAFPSVCKACELWLNGELFQNLFIKYNMIGQGYGSVMKRKQRKNIRNHISRLAT